MKYGNDELKTFWKTTEFRGLVGIASSFAAYALKEWNPLALMIGITCLGCGYIISRSLFKQHRQILKYSATKASEFYVFVASATSTAGIGLTDDKTGWVFIILVGVQYLVYCIGRGIVKGLNKSNTTVQMIS